jgi:salicylate hydroxylase
MAALNNHNQKIRIAISGGGIAGATLINALLKHEHVDVQIYESAAEFSERGAAVGLSRIAQDALNEIGITDVLEKAGAVPMNSSRAIMVCFESLSGQLS